MQVTIPLKKVLALQTQAMSVWEHPEAPMEEMAQVRAQVGILSSWAEARATPAATAKTVETFILID